MLKDRLVKHTWGGVLGL